jgi:hypothetical protein
MGFVAARAYARKLCVERGVDSQAKWTAFSRSGDRPRDSPGNPHQTYKGKGRLGYDDWFGKPAAHVSRVFLERFLKCFELRRQTSPVFTRTRAYVQHLLARWMRPLGSPRHADHACTPRPVRASGGRFHSRITLGSSTYTQGCLPPQNITLLSTRTRQTAVTEWAESLTAVTEVCVSILGQCIALFACPFFYGRRGGYPPPE